MQTLLQWDLREPRVIDLCVLATVKYNEVPSVELRNIKSLGTSAVIGYSCGKTK
jgi:hypothetical protein